MNQNALTRTGASVNSGLTLGDLPTPDQLKHLGDVLLEVEVELDRKVVSLRQVLELDAGSVLKLSRSAGENIDIFVGGALVAFGEIVVIEDMMGVRITDFNTEE